MKKITLLLSVLVPLCITAQVSFTFEDGSAEGWAFNAPGRWKADNVNPLSGSYSLHHIFDNSMAATDVAVFNIAGLCLSCSEITWQFAIRHGADPSSSNKWSFILMSDTGVDGILTGTDFNGYSVGVNLTGYDDTLRLWHLNGGKVTPVITTDVNWQTDVGVDNGVVIRVIRKPSGEWLMEARIAGGMLVRRSFSKGGGPGAWGKSEPATHTPKFAGISYTYTSTRDRLLWIDDVSVDGIFIPDTVPPSVVSVSALTPNILQVIFNEEPDATGLRYDNVNITGGIHVTSIERRSPEVYGLHLNEKITNRIQYTLAFNELCDLAGNCSSSVSADFVPVYGITGDVVITEIMPDPSPPLQLPNDEYLELTNLSEDSLSLMNWILIADSDTTMLPPFRMRSGEIIILCSASDTMKYSGYGRTAGLTPFPSLNDSGETLALRDGSGALIHSVSYSPALYKDEMRSGGGWSMEMTDKKNPFNAPDAWRASVDPSGGTPGRENSQAIPAPDNRCPEVIASWPVAPDKIRILFDESIMGAFLREEWNIDGKRALSACSDDIADRAIVITCPEGVLPGRIYSLQIPSDASDFAGNAPCISLVRFGLPETPIAGEIMFNELLFDPVPPCSDYIELYNNSDKVIDLSQLFLSSSKGGENGSAVIVVSHMPRQLLPGKYVALTTDKDIIAEYYTCSDRMEIHEVPSLPSMPDDAGAVLLLDRELNIIDRVEYSSSMHMMFFSGTEGIALEKVGPELSSDFSYNWHSASESCNWGTPGAPNSVLLPPSEEQPGMTLSSERISPDGDGFEDVLSVNVIPGGIDNVMIVTVFNGRGFIVRRLAERFFAGDGALFVWDGTADNGSRLPAGLYMIMAESYNSRGQTRRWKDVCALLYR